MDMDLQEISEDILRMAKRKACDLAEVYIKTSRGINVEAKDQRVDTFKNSRDFIIALRIIKDKRLGFSFTTDIRDIERKIDEAIESSQWIAEDIYNDIPEPEGHQQVSIIDEEIKAIKEEEIIKDVLLLEESALSYDNRIKKVRNATLSVRYEKTVIVNSKGVNVSYEGSHASAYMITLADDGRDSQTGWDFSSSRKMANLDLSEIGRNASRRAIELLGSRRIKPVRVSVVLDAPVAAEFLGILSSSLSAESVQKKKSMLADKMGRSVVSPIIDIIDDGTIPWAMGTRPVDDEGTPTSRKELVSRGVLCGFIHNTYTARKANVMTTGNAIRHSLQSLPGVGILNLYIKPMEGEEIQSRDESLLRCLQRGILITSAMGMHTANPISGDFSIGISGLWIEKGEVVYPVREAIISGNILDLFKKIKAIGRDMRFYGELGSPSLLIEDVDISA